MKKEIVTCDECGKQKGDVNHWFRALQNADSIRIMQSEVHPYLHTSEVGALFDLCGQACVIQAVQKWMGAQSKSQPPIEPVRIVSPAEEQQTAIDIGNILWRSTPSSPPEYRHKPQCAMVCSEGVDVCDCQTGSQIASPLSPDREREFHETMFWRGQLGL